MCFGPRGSRVISLIIDEQFTESLFPKGMSPWRWYQGLPYASSIWQFLFDLKNNPTEPYLKESMIQLVSVLIDPSLESISLKT